MLANYNKTFFELALGFPSPWKVSSVELDLEDGSVHIKLGYDSRTYESDSGEVYNIYDFRKSRTWQHLPVLQYKCYLHCSIPRVRDLDGKVKSIPVPWSGSHDSYTYQFNDYVIDVLLATHNQTKTSELVKTSFYIVNTIMHKSVQLGLDRRNLSEADLKYLSIDEKSVGKGHKYGSVLVDPIGKRILDVCQGRDKSSVKAMLGKVLTADQLLEVEAISMDMWEAFMNAAKELMPKADIVHDKFHIVGYLGKAIDTCRKKEVRNNEILRNSKYALLKNQQNRTQGQAQVFDRIMDTNLYTAQAWALANQFRETVLASHQEVEAIAFFDMWTLQAQEADIDSINKLSKTLNKHKEGILNYVKHKITNALSERINGMIQTIKSVGRGYRTFENLRSAILFFNGKLELRSHKS